ncbi:hypothetical protein AVEN_201090-1 [Araneus ventricosus]|uniref:Uncharacterized protein n=1 Tax=Araneus ventricosus TaxID=182803 RepID=A0A4Y2FYT9_ARAVE|nr:hypothetical protein AVEN_201090-1 [Araneus ventricosus]
MRNTIVIGKNNSVTYRKLPSLLYIITSYISTFVVSLHELQNSHVKLFCRQFIKPGGHCILQLFITSKTFIAQKVFQLKDIMEITRSKVRTIGTTRRKCVSGLCLNAVNTWLNELAVEEYNMVILKLVDRCDKCLNVGGYYVEK